VKLCKDCRWCKPEGFSNWLAGLSRYRWARCAHPRFKPSPVTGKIVHDEFCANERKSYEFVDTCGEDGKYFEPKHSAGGMVTRPAEWPLPPSPISYWITNSTPEPKRKRTRKKR
jgi:hypothetical protein